MAELDKKALELKQMLENYEKEKQLITEAYQKKVIALDQQIVELEKKIDNLDQIIKDAFAARDQDTERMRKELKSDRIIYVAEKNDFAEEKKKFKEDAAAFEKWAEEERKKLASMRDMTMSSINDFKARQEHMAESIDKNEALLEEIGERKAAAENALKNLDDKKGEIEANKNKAVALKTRAETILQDAQTEKIRAGSMMDEASRLMSDVKETEAVSKKAMAESRAVFEALDKKKAEADGIIKKAEGRTKQNQAEAEKNKNDSVVNRAKEITLNERERALNEREKSVKILQDKL